MNTNSLLLSLTHLKPDEEMPVSWTIPSAFLGFSAQDEVQPQGEITAQGTCSLVDDYAVVRLDIRASFSVPCALCNERFDHHVVITSWTHQERVDQLRQMKWDLSDVIREEIVISLPFFPLCGGKECLHVEEIRKYLHTPQQKDEKDETTSPFQDFFNKNG